MNQVPNAGIAAIVSTLQSARSNLEQSISNKMDPTAALVQTKAHADMLHGAVDEVRKFAPALGEVWDTLRSVLAAVTQHQGVPGPGAGEGVIVTPPTPSQQTQD